MILNMFVCHVNDRQRKCREERRPKADGPKSSMTRVDLINFVISVINMKLFIITQRKTLYINQDFLSQTKHSPAALYYVSSPKKTIEIKNSILQGQSEYSIISINFSPHFFSTVIA